VDTIKREILEETNIELKEPILPFGFCELIHAGLEDHRMVLLLHGKSDETPQETEDCFAFWSHYEDVKDKLAPFSVKAYEIWKKKEFSFSIVNDVVSD
jgi:8-oxo-dGTP pyrophosphatase MutT (NUDIX family)